MSRILIWSPNYAPELTGIPPLVTDAAEWLVGCGHDVSVVTAMPNYPERRIHPRYRGALWSSEYRNGVSVHRSWLRVRPEEKLTDKALYEFTFAAFSLPRVLRRLHRSDVLVCVIPSLAAAVTAAAVARAARLGRSSPRLVLWVQDLVLSAALSVDGVGPRIRRLLGALGAAERLAARAADGIVVCSPGFRDYLTARGVDAQRIVTTLNWVDVNWIGSGTRTRANGRPRFLYAGNLGYTQGFETLFEAARLVGPQIELEIVGDGNGAGGVRGLAENLGYAHVRLPVPRREFPQLLADADAHIVIQRQICAGANLPSKISSYLASGRPIVASIDPETPAAELLRASGAALLVPPESPIELASAMQQLCEEPRLREELGQRGREYASVHLSREKMLAELERAFVG